MKIEGKYMLWSVAALFVVQWLVPAGMIYKYNHIRTKGTVYKFESRPVDPADPFRGRYLTLSHKPNTLKVGGNIDWNGGEQVYLTLANGKDGFAKFSNVSNVTPRGNVDYIKASIDYVSKTDSLGTLISVNLPFSKYYLNESLATEAEEAYTDAVNDPKTRVYSKVAVLNGQSSIIDLYINDTPLQSYIKKLLAEK